MPRFGGRRPPLTGHSQTLHAYTSKYIANSYGCGRKRRASYSFCFISSQFLMKSALKMSPSVLPFWFQDVHAISVGLGSNGRPNRRELIASRFVENFEWKSTDWSSPKLVNCNAIHLWLALNAENRRFDATKKILSEARLARLIPAIGFRDIVLRFRRENNALNHSRSAPFLSPDPRFEPKPDASRTALCGAAARRASNRRGEALPPPERCYPKDLRPVEGVRPGRV